MPDAVPPDEELEALLAYLRDERGADFTGYERASLTRLVDRRMRTAGVDGYGEYVDLLQVEPAELEALLDVLLIDVTAVFRDPAAWEELAASLLPEALAALGPDEPVRVWSAACASGEEAHSLAILLHTLPVEQVRAVLRSVVDAGEVPDPVDVELTDRFGRPQRRRLTATPLLRRHGEVHGAVLTLADRPTGTGREDSRD